MTEISPRKARLTIIGRQYPTDTEEPSGQKESRTELCVPALLSEITADTVGKNAPEKPVPGGSAQEKRWQLRWKEEAEEVTDCTALVEPGRLLLHREGAVRTDLEILEGRETFSEYRTSLGSLPLTVRGHRVSVRRSSAALTVRAEYTMPDWGLRSVVTLRAEFL